MNFFSILKLSFHGLMGNKLRTLLTIIVLAVVSFVVVLLGGLGYSLYQSIDKNIGEVYRTQVSVINATPRIKDTNNNTYNAKLSVEQAGAIIEVLDNDDGYLTGVSFFDPTQSWGLYGPSLSVGGAGDRNGFYAIPFYAGSNPFVGLKNDGSTVIDYGAENYLESGRMWNKTDEKTQNVWLSASAMSRYAVGDKITVTTSPVYDGLREIADTQKEYTVTVCGFLNIGNNGYMSYMFLDYHNFDMTQGRISDQTWFFNGGGTSMTLGGVYAYMVPQLEYEYGLAAQNYIKSIMKSAEKAVSDPYGPDAFMSSSCNTIESMEMTTIVMLILFTLIIGVSAIIVLLSIGSVANTIKISAEQNRKFFGVMKAIGMKNKNLRHILTGQIIIMTLLGVAIASLAAYLIIGAAETILTMLITSMFWQLAEPYVICAISPLVPILVAAVLIGIVLLFTRANMYAVSRMDVISVINEVS